VLGDYHNKFMSFVSVLVTLYLVMDQETMRPPGLCHTDTLYSELGLT